MRCNFKIYFVIIVFLFSAVNVYSADIAKIGVVDFQRILKESKAGKAVAKKLRDKQNERTTDLKEKQKEIIKLQKFIESIELVETKEEREERKIELNIKIAAFKKLDDKYSLELNAINDKHTSRIKKEVNDVVVKIGKKGGYLLIVEKKDILYSPDAVDITTMVIQQYNK